MAMLEYERKALIAAAVIAAIAWLVWPRSNDRTPSPQAAAAPAKAPARDSDEMMGQMACEAAKNAVLEHLKSPASADFPNCVFSAHEYKITMNAERTRWGVQGHVDADNAFGASIRSRFVVLMDKGPGNGPSAFTPYKVAVE